MTVIQKLPVEFYVSWVTKGKKSRAWNMYINVSFVFSFSNKFFNVDFSIK